MGENKKEKKSTKKTKKKENVKYCGECGQKLKKTDKFCENCGAPTSKEAVKEVKEEPKKKSNKALIITLIVLGSIFFIAFIVLVLLLLLGVFNKKPETSWGKIYAAALQEKVDYHQKYPKAEMYGVIKGVSNYNIKIMDIGEKYPVMISEAKKGDKTSRMIYYIENNKANYITSENNDEIKLFYNTELKDYVWYYETKDEISTSYNPIGRLIDQSKNDQTNNKCYNCTKEQNEQNKDKKADKYTSYYFHNNENIVDTDIENYIKYKDQILIEVDKKLPTQELNIDKPSTINTSLVGLEETYKETEELINNKDKKNIEKQEKEIASKVEEYNKKQEELAITSSNLQSKVGEHLKWFSAAYLGPYYGFNHVYKYIDVTGKVSVPGTIQEFMTYEISGAKSIAEIKNNCLTYMEQSVFDNLNRRQYKGLFGEFHDYNGKVYLVRGGIGDGPYIKSENARLVSYSNGEGKVQLDVFDGLSGEKEKTITVTFRYKDGKYIITNYS